MNFGGELLGRIQFTQEFNTLNITIPSKKNWIHTVFLIVWMYGWYLGEKAGLMMLFEENPPTFAYIMLILWLIAWTLGGLSALYHLFWALFGYEIITVENGIMTIKKSIFGIGLRHKYEIEAIKNMLLAPFPSCTDFKKRKRFRFKKSGRISFDYAGKTIRFAKDVDRAEVRLILEKLDAKFLPKGKIIL